MSADLFSLVVVWLLLSGGVALLARSQGRSPITWFLLAVVMSPLFAFLAAALSPSPKDRAS